MIGLVGRYEDGSCPAGYFKWIKDAARCVSKSVLRFFGVGVQLMRAIRRCGYYYAINVGLVGRYSEVNRVITRFRSGEGLGSFFGVARGVGVTLFGQAVFVLGVQLRDRSVSFRYVDANFFRLLYGVGPFDVYVAISAYSS